MNWEIILTSAGIATGFSTLISSAIAFIFYKKQKDVDYMYDYRKYILEKRKETYNMVEDIISQLTIRRFLSGSSRPVPGFFDNAGDENPFHAFNEKIIKCMGAAFWMSDEMCSHLKKLNDFIFKIGEEAKRLGDTTEIQFETAASSYDFIRKLKEPITSRYFKDICQLDNIEKFKKKKLFY